jgi:hypothetical protein
MKLGIPNLSIFGSLLSRSCILGVADSRRASTARNSVLGAAGLTQGPLSRSSCVIPKTAPRAHLCAFSSKLRSAASLGIWPEAVPARSAQRRAAPAHRHLGSGRGQCRPLPVCDRSSARAATRLRPVSGGWRAGRRGLVRPCAGDCVPVRASGTSGEGGIRTLERACAPYSLSRRVPSATRPPLRESPCGAFDSRRGRVRGYPHGSAAGGVAESG